MKKITKRSFIASLALFLCSAATQAQVISTVAGNGTPTFGGDGFAATLAQINNPKGVAFDAVGNMYIADANNHRIRKVTATGDIYTIAGTGVAGISGNGGPATAAMLNTPHGLATDHTGNLYVADVVNNMVRKITPAGTIVTFAGTGATGTTGDGGPATAATISNPTGVAVDMSGNVYITSPSDHKIRKVNSAGIITTVAGTGTLGFSGDGGPATAAMLNTPHAVAFDGMGNMYIADQYNGRIRKVTAAGVITTIAGTGAASSAGDGGPATAADILNPTSVTIDAANNIYIASYNAQAIRMVNPAGTISHYAGVTYSAGYNGDGGLSDTSKINHPYSIITGNDGNIYIADQLNNRIRKIVTTPCTTADAGSIVSTNGNAFCSIDSSVLYMSGSNTGSGITYLWQSSPDGISWSNTGTNAPGYATGTIGAAAIQYRLIATCGAVSVSDTTPAYVITPVSTVIPAVTVNATPGTVVSAGTTVTFVAMATYSGTAPAYQWLKNGTPIPGATTNPYITSALANNDTITCILYSSMPCATPDSAISTGTVMSIGTGVADMNGLPAFALLPNPNNGSFHITGTLAGAKTADIQVLNVVGQAVYHTSVKAANSRLNADILLPETCASGIYMLRVQTESGYSVQRLSVQR